MESPKKVRCLTLSNYTTEVRFICEMASGLSESKGADSIDEILEKSWEKVFNFSFPIFDERYREGLCKHILLHYYTREIGYETVGLWKLKLKSKLYDIMPYYNEMYKSTLLEFNPLQDVDLTREHELTRDVTEDNTENKSGQKTSASVIEGNGTTENGGTNLNLYNDTPTQQLGALFPDNNSPNYLTNARKVTDTSNGTTYSKTQGDNTDTYNEANIVDRKQKTVDAFLETFKGKTGGKSYSKLLTEYRETFLNIDMLIIDELKDLFINLW